VKRSRFDIAPILAEVECRWDDLRQVLLRLERDHAAMVDSAPAGHCDACRHWSPRLQGWGLCWMSIRDDAPFRGQPGIPVDTIAKFGCSKWEGRVPA
jgi:hypothetical protein